MLDKRTILLYSNTGVEKHNAAVAQSVERRIGSAEVTGPIPVSSSFEKSGNLENTRFPLFCVPESLQTMVDNQNKPDVHLHGPTIQLTI